MTDMQQDFPLTASAVRNFYEPILYPLFDENMGMICYGTILYPDGMSYSGPVYSTPLDTDEFTSKLGACRVTGTAYYPTSLSFVFYKVEGEFTIFPLYVPKN